MMALSMAAGYTVASPPLEYVIVAARQRTSSSYLAASITTYLDESNATIAVRDFDEPWLPAAQREKNQLVDSLVPDVSSLSQRMANPFDFVRKLRHAYCHSMHCSSRNGVGEAACRSRCVVVLKVFDRHFRDSFGTPAFRPPLDLPGTIRALTPLFGHPGARVVVLERNPIEEHCSLSWAMQSGSWWRPDMTPAALAAYEDFKRGCNKQTPSLQAADAVDKFGDPFQRDHALWFSALHSALRSAPGALGRSLNATYSENVDQHEALMARIAGHLLT